MGFRSYLARRGIMSTDVEVMVRALFGKTQAAPTVVTIGAVITPAAIIAGLITGEHVSGGTVTYTLPTGTLMDAALTVYINANDSFDFTIINLSAAVADTITLVAGVGFTIVGQALIESAHVNSEFPSSGTFRVRKTAADTFVAYRL